MQTQKSTPTQQQTNVLSDREYQVEHTMHASAAKVFQAYTDRALVPQWWGMPGADFRVEEMDVRPGGKYRFVQHLPDGTTMTSHGTYLDVQPFTRLVYTFVTDKMPGEIRATLELREENGRTHLTLTSLTASMPSLAPRPARRRRRLASSATRRSSWRTKIAPWTSTPRSLASSAAARRPSQAATASSP
jgi:uncharacterized protein YndB with AHSA1/START domain